MISAASITPLQLIAAAPGDAVWWAPVIFTALVFGVIVLFGRVALAQENTRGAPKGFIPRLAEHVYLFIENMCVGTIGSHHGPKYIPLVFTIFTLVLVSNLFGLVGLIAPTAALGVTFGLAVIVVMYVQWEAIRVLGFLGWIGHFFGPKLGCWLLPVTLLLFVVEFVSEAAKMLSLSIRLYGNMFGEHEVKNILGHLVSVPVNLDIGGIIRITEFSIPLDAIVLPLGAFISLVQALVFSILTCVYLSLFLSHHEEGHAAAH